MKVTTYLHIEPEYRYGGTLAGAKVKRVTQNRPKRPISGCVIVKLTLDVDGAVFDPILAALELDVPEQLAEVVTAEVEDSHEPELVQ